MCEQLLRKRQCVICNRQLFGRSDKVFCDIKCKNRYHSEARKTTRTAMRQTVQVLQKNYQILAGLLRNGTTRAVIDRLALEKVYYNFDHVTGVELRSGVPVLRIFEFTLEFRKHNRVVISVDPERQAVSPFLFRRWERVMQETEEVRRSG